MNYSEFMFRYEQVSRKKYEEFLKQYKRNHKVYSNLFFEWYDIVDLDNDKIIARNYLDKYYILKQPITVNLIVNNLNIFTQCKDVVLYTEHYPFYIHSDEPKFDEHLNDEIKEVRVENDSLILTL